MALIETDDGIKEYWNEVKEQYPDMTFEMFEKVCKTPFKFFRMKIQEDDMPNIHIKYFGKFKVHLATLRQLLKKVTDTKRYRIKLINDKKNNNIIDEEKYNELKAKIDKRFDGYTQQLQDRIKLTLDDKQERDAKKNNKKSN